ncbi:MAG TPA: GNAT family N-acetyltransferase [Victivallales bacterium]|nr:GNAT family N-acetyltransferase [Victivallales bacterium]
MIIKEMEKEDFFKIRNNLKDYWGERYKLFEQMHQPLFFYEFGKTAYIIKESNEIAGYLLGLLPQTSRSAYVHMIAVKEKFQNHNYGKLLYEHFISFSKSQGYKKIKAVTSPSNINSIRFHKKIGMKLIGNKNREGIPVVNNYSGVGDDRVIFEKDI